MHLISYAYGITSLAIAVAYLNARFVKMQTTVAVMVASLLASCLTLLLDKAGVMPLAKDLIAAVQSIDFSDILINGFLGFLLFAGSLSVESREIKLLKWDIGILATFSTIVSTIVIGFSCYWGLALLGPSLGLPALSLNACLLFGALISPTDPIAVLATMKQLKAPAKLTTRLAGESLFNDGVGIVLFLVLYRMTYQIHESFTFTSTLTLFVQQACGGLIAGYLLAKLYQVLMKNIHKSKLAILVTLMITTGGYTLTHALSLSGPLAMVVAGILIAEYSKADEKVHEHLHDFWEIIDEVLNIILFFLLGFEMLLIPWTPSITLLMISIIPLVLLTRWLTVALPMQAIQALRRIHPMTTKILVWGGLRGGLAVALALTLPHKPGDVSHSLILAMTFAVVVFSILIQATTIPALVKKIKAH